MGKINFPQMMGNILQFNVTQLFQIIAEQEVEKVQLQELISSLVKGAVALSQVELSQDGIRVTPKPALPVDLRMFSAEELVQAVMRKTQEAEDQPTIEISPEKVEVYVEDEEEVLASSDEPAEAPEPSFDPPMENENFEKPE